MVGVCNEQVKEVENIYVQTVHNSAIIVITLGVHAQGSQ